MNTDIENITEELILRYVEGDLDSEESKRFQKILSQNEYLRIRVNVLKSISDKQPMKSPSRKIHNQILADIGVSSDSSRSFLRKYFHFPLSVFNRRGTFAAISLSVFIAVFSSFVIYDNMNSDYEDHQITNEPVKQKEIKEAEEDGVSS